MFNAEKYLEKCVESLLNQTVENYEIILVDDGSNDKSVEICDKLSAQNEKVIALHKKNSGPSATRNCGIDSAKGEYILFADSDDLVDNNYIELLTSPLISDEYDLVVSGFIAEHSKEKKEKKSLSDNSDKDFEKQEFFELINSQLIYYVWNKCFKREIIIKNKIRFDESLRYCEDLCFVLEYIRHMEKKIRYINRFPYIYFIRQSSVTGSTYHKDGFTGKRQRYFNEFEKTFDSMKNVDDKYLNKFYSYYFDGFIDCLKNTFDKRNNDSLIKKLIQNHKIVISKEYKKCCKNLDKNQYSKMFLFICRLRCAALILFFLKLANR